MTDRSTPRPGVNQVKSVPENAVEIDPASTRLIGSNLENIMADSSEFTFLVRYKMDANLAESISNMAFGFETTGGSAAGLNFTTIQDIAVTCTIRNLAGGTALSLVSTNAKWTKFDVEYEFLAAGTFEDDSWLYGRDISAGETEFTQILDQVWQTAGGIANFSECDDMFMGVTSDVNSFAGQITRLWLEPTTRLDLRLKSVRDLFTKNGVPQEIDTGNRPAFYMGDSQKAWNWNHGQNRGFLPSDRFAMTGAATDV